MLEGTRLNKFLASCGLGSRRACDALVQRGGVTLNGETCTNPATRIQEGDILRVEGKRVSPKKTTTILLKKPRGYVCSKHDELERATIYELLPPKFSHLNHVGRLEQLLRLFRRLGIQHDRVRGSRCGARVHALRQTAGTAAVGP